MVQVYFWGLGFVFLFFILSKEVLILDEDFLLIVSFSIFFVNVYYFFGHVVAASLSVRSQEIEEIFTKVYKNKLEFLSDFSKILNYFDELDKTLVVVYSEARTISRKLKPMWLKVYSDYLASLVESILIVQRREEVNFLRKFFSKTLFFVYDSMMKYTKVKEKEEEFLIELELDIKKR